MAIALLLICLCPIVALTLLSATAERPAQLGVRNGRLPPCPQTPNCVSTQSTDDRQWIEPLSFTGSAEAAMTRLMQVTERLPSAKIVTARDDYLHVEFTSRVFRFVDDAEFFLEGNRIHFRSASRTGYSDFGVNRERMERIRAAFEAETQRDESLD